MNLTSKLDCRIRNFWDTLSNKLEFLSIYLNRYLEIKAGLLCIDSHQDTFSNKLDFWEFAKLYKTQLKTYRIYYISSRTMLQ
jgi:hypothetical protein